MKDGLIERIRQVGHWRINFRPASGSTRSISLGQCREAVEQSRVSIRGWDFPHISHQREDGAGGYSNAGDHVENWTEWSGFNEFWRMYKSTQFLSYVSLREDTHQSDYNTQGIRIIDIASAIYSITEFFEFAHRLRRHGLYETGADISISLRGMEGRQLSAGRGRMPFFDPHLSHALEYEFKRSLDKHQLEVDHQKIAVDACLDIFDQFGWNPARSQIESDQEQFYQRNFRF